MNSLLLLKIAKDRYPQHWHDVVEPIAAAFNYDGLDWYDPLRYVNAFKVAEEAIKLFKQTHYEQELKSMSEQILGHIVLLSQNATRSVNNKLSDSDDPLLAQRLQLIDENLAALLNQLDVNHQLIYRLNSEFFYPKTLIDNFTKAMDKQEQWVFDKHTLLELITTQKGVRLDYIEKDYSEDDMLSIVTRALDIYQFDSEHIHFFMLNTLARYWTGFSEPLARKLNSMGIVVSNYSQEELDFIWENVCFQEHPLAKLNFMLEEVGLPEPAQDKVENLYWLKEMLGVRRNNILSAESSSKIVNTNPSSMKRRI